MAKFNPDKYLKEKQTPTFDAKAFDPDSYLRDKKQTNPGEGKSTEAFLQGAGNAAALGYAPQIAAGIEQLIPNPSGSVDKELKSKGFNIEEPKDDYLSVRDEFLKRQESLKASNPYASGLGALAGTIGGGSSVGGLIGKAIPALAVKSGSALLPTISKSAAQGAAVAGAYNPGDTEGEIDPIQFKDRSNAALFGGLIGGSVPAAIGIPKIIKGGLTEITSHLTGKPAQDIATYAKHTDAVNKIIKKSGGNAVEMADDVRKLLSDKIQDYRRGLNDSISKELQNAPKDSMVSVAPIFESLKSSMEKIDKDLNPEQYKYISDLVKKISTKVNPDGKINLQTAHKLTEFLQDEAKPAYGAGGQIFSKGDQYEKAAKAAASMGRQVRNAASEEIGNGFIKSGYESLSKLHGIEKNLNKNLLTPGKPDAALFSAASGANPRNAKTLEELSSLTGADIMGQLKLLSAARAFGGTEIVPSHANGLSGTKMGAGFVLGGLLGSRSGEGGMGHAAEGGALGAAATSPLAVKGAINAANMASKLVPSAIPNAASSIANMVTPGMGGIAAGQMSSRGFQQDPFVSLSKSPDTIKNAVDNGVIPMEAVKAIVNKSGNLTREDYIRAQRVLSSAQGRQAMRAAMFHVSTIGNPESALGPAAPIMAEQAIKRGGNAGPK